MANVDAVPAPETGVIRAATMRGAEGFFRAAQDAAGRWWILTPEGAPCFVKCVHGVRLAGGQGDGALPLDTAARLRAWRFNAVGVSAGTVGRDDGLPFMALADFARVGRQLVAPGLRLPDVFDPDWAHLAGHHAAVMAGPLQACHDLIGWVTDDQLGWAQPAGTDRPSLLQLCLSLEPSFAAYHAAWEFALALHGGRIETLARAWGTALPNKEVVRELTRAEKGLGTRGYLRDDARWTQEFARRYFTSTAVALRAADPNHLVLGCRFDGLAGSQVLSACVYPAVDVAMPDWRELPAPGNGPAASPFLAGDVCWATPEFLKLPTAARVLRLTSVEWMLRRGRTALERTARHPAVVGYAWSQWQDEPGEQPPFARGLVHVNGAEAREHTELLTQFNVRAESLRHAASSFDSS